MEKADNQNFDADSKIPFKAAKLDKKVAMGNVTHEFTITYKGVQLENKPDYSMGKAYVVLGKPIGPWEKKTPWKKVLDFVLNDCGSIGSQDESSVLCAVKKKVKDGGYNSGKGIWFKDGFVNISKYLDKDPKTDKNARIVNCLDAAILTEVFSNTMGIETEIRCCLPFSKSVYHAYNRWNGKIYDSLFSGLGGDGTLSEKEFYERNGVYTINLYQNKMLVLKWKLPFDYIEKQKDTNAISSFDDIPGSEGTVYQCDPIYIYLLTKPEETYQIVD